MQLFKSVYRLGEEIIGTLDLSKATIPCLQVNVHTHTHMHTYTHQHMHVHMYITHDIRMYTHTHVYTSH